MNGRADLDAFIARFTPEIAALIRSTVARMRARLPGAFEVVYDNYYALSSRPRASSAHVMSARSSRARSPLRHVNSTGLDHCRR